MSFPPNIAEKVLVDAKRSCSICHKFCGTKIELHHIRPKSEDGENTYENCIPLCFDCHADVRAYDPKHPKGKKCSESELIDHQDRWYAKVNVSIGIDAFEHIEMPTDASDPAYREGIRSLLVDILGRAPTKGEVDKAISKAKVSRGVDNVCFDELKQLEPNKSKIQSLGSQKGKADTKSRNDFLDKRFPLVIDDYKRRGSPKYMIDTFLDLTKQEKAELYDRAILWKKNRKSKNNPYLLEI